jgi:hypothetical protein
MSELERKVFRAVGKVHRSTNLPIFTHNAYGTGPSVPKDAGLHQLDVLESVGVKPERIAVGHTCWAGYIMNTDWNPPHESPWNSAQFFAEHSLSRHVRQWCRPRSRARLVSSVATVSAVCSRAHSRWRDQIFEPYISDLRAWPDS